MTSKMQVLVRTEKTKHMPVSMHILPFSQCVKISMGVSGKRIGPKVQNSPHILGLVVDFSKAFPLFSSKIFVMIVLFITLEAFWYVLQFEGMPAVKLSKFLLNEETSHTV